MYRVRDGVLQVFLAHPGGPFFVRRDAGHWTIPKGEIEPGEEALAAAVREFEEETGIEAQGPFIELGSIRQRGGKTVYAWGFAGDWDAAKPLTSTLMTMEWPPGSGQMRQVPEIDQARFFALDEAHRKIKDTQRPFLDRLVIALKVDPRRPGSPCPEAP
jgi:predicted NUDIX family NTP pyrophosphohydrolase